MPRPFDAWANAGAQGTRSNSGNRTKRRRILCFARMSNTRWRWAVPQIKRHEHAVRVVDIADERRALGETVVAVERERRAEIVPGARLETEPRHAAGTRDGDDVAQHGTPHSPAALGLRGMHRLDLAVIGREMLQ